MANLADAYGSGELRLTVEQNFIIPNVPDERVDELLREPLLSRYTPFPGKVVGSMVACTGKQFCGFAQIETKKQAYTMAEHLESVLDFPNGDLRMIWTGCPNSCAPVQVADIGLMGCQVKNPSGEKGIVDGVNIFCRRHRRSWWTSPRSTLRLKRFHARNCPLCSKSYASSALELFGNRRLHPTLSLHRGGKSTSLHSTLRVFRRRWAKPPTSAQDVDTSIRRPSLLLSFRMISSVHPALHQKPSLKL